MFFSKKYKLLFIASPKTGTVSIHEALQKIDSDGSRWCIEYDNKKIESKDLPNGIIGHAKAKELRKALGKKTFHKLNTIAFVRNPLSKLVSSYFYIKKSNLLNFLKIKGEKNNFKRRLGFIISSISAKILPFKLWALMYPYKSNISYISDNHGKIIVDHVGRTDHLNKYFHIIMSRLNIDSEKIKVGKKNISNHKPYELYFKSEWFKKIIYKKMKDDIDLYEKICKNFI